MESSLEPANMTRVQHFVLLGLATSPSTRDALFAIFLALYLLTLLQNTLNLYLIVSHAELCKPMYISWATSAALPHFLHGLHDPTLLLCLPHLTECTLMVSMAYGHYMTICHPLHYPLLMRPQVCLGLAVSSWLGGLLVSVVKTTCIASLSYCGPNVLNHFFCDVSPLLNLSCTHVALTELVDFISAIIILWGCFLMTMASYMAISRAVLRMPSATARHKALSTCASHLVVVGIFYSATIFIYARPSRMEAMDLNKVLSVIYTAVTPMCNPVIYCLRNREVQTAFRRTLRWSTG
uniref:G-protein coupled receptors family 1 profile domain-containing protein n=1 Tax=Cavia porcellus TaxID=10141 RepID=H0W367_CAVPO